MKLPSHIRDAIVRRVFADIETLRWRQLSNNEKSAQYTVWLQDPDVGGTLTQFMAPDRARVWLKDVPVKEYARSAAGIGVYASYAARTYDPALLAVRAAFPYETAVLSNSPQVKPLRVAVRVRDTDIVVAWGPLTDLKHLVWRALNEQADGDPREWVVVIVDDGVELSKMVSDRHRSLSARVGLRIVHAEIPR